MLTIYFPIRTCNRSILRCRTDDDAREQVQGDAERVGKGGLDDFDWRTAAGSKYIAI